MQGFFIFQVAFLTVVLSLATIAVAGNILILLAFKLYKEARKRYNLMFIGQAIADLLMALGIAIGISLGPVRALLGSQGLSNGYCISITFIAIFGISMSQWTMLFIGVERWYAIAMPLSYKAAPKTRFAKYATTFALCFTLVQTSLAYVGAELEKPTVGVCNLGTGTTKVYLQSTMVFSLIQAAALVIFYVAGLVALRKRSNESPSAASNQSQAHQRQLESELKVQKTIRVIMGVYLIGWITPISLITTASLLGYDPGFLWLLRPLSSAANAACNFFVYYCKNEELRKAFQKMTHQLAQHSQVDSISHPTGTL